MVTVVCDSVGGRPQADITWYINDQQATETPTVSYPVNSDPDLSNTRSVLKYEGSASDYKVVCQISGHNVTELNYGVTENLCKYTFLYFIHSNNWSDIIEILHFQLSCASKRNTVLVLDLSSHSDCTMHLGAGVWMGGGVKIKLSLEEEWNFVEVKNI